MTAAALIFATLAALLHGFIWSMESLTWRKPSTWRRFGVTTQAEAETQAMFAFNQGFYNLFLGIGALVGAALVLRGCESAGWALVIGSCASMLGAAIVLASCGHKYWRAALTQGAFPVLAIGSAIAAICF